MNAYFLTSGQRQRLLAQLSSGGQSAFQELLHNYKNDLSSNVRVSITKSQKLKIWGEAGRRLSLGVEQKFVQSGAVDETQLKELWHQVVTQFYRENFWRHLPSEAEDKPARGIEDEFEDFEWVEKKSRDMAREMWPYLWKLFLSLIVVKVVLLYLGSHGYLYWGK